MLVDPQSHNLIRNPQVDNPPSSNYFTIYSQGQQYRLLSRQYKSHSTIINIWTVFWLFKTLVLASFIFVQNYKINSLIVISLTLLQETFQTILAWRQRKNVSNLVFICSLQCLVCLVFIVVFVALEIHFTIIPCLAFCLSIVLTTGLKVRNKGRIILFCFILVQLALVSLKYDNFIQISWNQVLLPLLPICLLSISAFTFLVIYSLLLKRYYSQTFQTKKYSLMFLVVGFVGMCALLAFIIGPVYFDFSMKINSIVTTSIVSMVTICLFVFEQEIVITFCRYKQVIEQNQKQTKFQIIPQPKQQIPALFRYSSNWFGIQDTTNQSNITSLDLPECIVCIQSKCEVVWLPCGHLTLCHSCSQDMLQNHMFSCVLCKQIPTKICKLETSSIKDNLIQREMGFIQAQRKKNRFNVSALFDIKIIK